MKNFNAPAAVTIPLDRRIAAQAARWFILLTSGEAGPKEQREFEAWRDADAEHERAWQRAQEVSRMAGLVPPKVGKAVLCRSVSAELKRRQTMKVLLALMTAVPAGWLATTAVPWRIWSADYSTAIGERRVVALPDGTQVHLNTASAIDVAFDAGRRTLLLRAGEVMVATAPDPLAAYGDAARPFVVVTGHGSARPVGTRFIVREQSGLTQVAVLEGAVELHPAKAGDIHLLRAGRAAGFDDIRSGVETALPSGAGLWTRGILAADDMRLDQLLGELSRYRSGILQCDPDIAGLRITGAFQLGNIDEALGNIAQLLSLDIRYRTRFWVTLVPSKK